MRIPTYIYIIYTFIYIYMYLYLYIYICRFTIYIYMNLIIYLNCIRYLPSNISYHPKAKVHNSAIPKKLMNNLLRNFNCCLRVVPLALIHGLF